MPSYCKFGFLFLLICFQIICYGQQTEFEEYQAYYKSDKFDSAKVYLNKALKKLPEGDKLKRSGYYIDYAHILKAQSNADSAAYFLNESEKILKNSKSPDFEKLFEISVLRAEISRYSRKRQLAVSYIQEAEKLYSEDFDNDKIAYFKNRKLAIWSEYFNNRKDSLLVIYNLADEILKKKDQIEDKSIIVYTLNELGFLELTNDKEKSLSYFLDAYSIAEDSDLKLAKVDVGINLGRIYQRRFKDYDKAIRYHKIALKSAKEINNIGQIKEAIRNLRICYALVENYETAMHYSDSIAHYIIEQNTKENALILDEIRGKYNLDIKDNELRAKQRSIYFLFTIIVLACIGLFVLLFYSKKVNDKNKQLRSLHKENEFLVSEANHRINNNLQLVIILISDELRKQSKANDSIKKILLKVRSIATLHEHLYQKGDKSQLETSDYLQNIKANFSEIFKDYNIDAHFKIDKIMLPADTAMYLGLLLTELCINSIKHAFHDQDEKKITFNLNTLNESILFDYSDNGSKEIAKPIKPKLIDKLCTQLAIDYKINTSDGFSFKFQKEF